MIDDIIIIILAAAQIKLFLDNMSLQRRLKQVEDKTNAIELG